MTFYGFVLISIKYSKMLIGFILTITLYFILVFNYEPLTQEIPSLIIAKWRLNIIFLKVLFQTEFSIFKNKIY